MSNKDGLAPKDVKIPFEKLGVQPGDNLMLESADGNEKFEVLIIGYVPGRSLLTTQPLIGGKQVLLKQDRPFRARSTKRNRAYAFSTQVLATPLQPYVYMHLQYPQALTTMEIRNAERIRVSLPGEVYGDTSLSGENWPRSVLITDLSQTGAGIQSKEKLGRSGEELRLRCVLTVADITKTFTLRSVIRGRQSLPESSDFNYSYGLQFRDLSEAAQIVLSAYIFEQQSR